MKEVAQTPLDSEWALPIAKGIGSALFVINLCASMTPMPALPKQLKGFEKYKLYQVSRQEDGRRRYRLRLGFFSSEADAEMVVSAVRNIYPTAFAGCVASEDQRYAPDSAAASGIHASLTTLQPAKPELALVEDPQSSSQPASATDKSPAISLELTTELSLEPEPVLAATVSVPLPIAPTVESAPAAAPNKAVGHTQVGAGKALPKQTAPAAAKPIMAASIVSSPVTHKTSELPLAHRAPQIVDDYVPVLDTTLTIRTLTRTEAEDPNRAKWFVVQLALSEQPVNLDAMPKLDIFAAYSLYSVALMEAGVIRHALRLGFFREQVSADAVMGYLKTFFAAPSVSQISASEHDRFAESKPVKQAPPQDKVVNLDNKREAPSRLTTATSGQSVGIVNRPAVVMPKTTASKPAVVQRAANKAQPDFKLNSAARPQSFLSRLIGRQLD